MANITFSMSSANTAYPRAIARSLMADLDLYPVVAVMGARQVGKSTLCRQIADGRGWPHRTLDDSDVREQAFEDPEGLLAGLGDGGAFIDEVQRAPNLLFAIKAVVDRDQRPGRYLVSGSNQPTVRGAVGDSLLGRAAYRTLRPLSLSELRLSDEHAGWSFLFAEQDETVLDELERRAAESGALNWKEVAATGGLPRAVRSLPEHRQRLLNDYIEVFASRDIREVIGIESTGRFESFLRLAASRTAQVLNVAGMAADLGAPVTTIKRWTDALVRSYLVEFVPPYSRNAGQRVIKAPKLMMVDSALALAAARETAPTGFHLETLIAAEISIWRDMAPGRGLHHWRLSSGQEVDFVLEEHGQLLPVEVKAAATIDIGDARHLRAFRAAYSNAPRGVLLSSDPASRVLASGIIAAPWWAVV
jgi:predicted AAA+ superfamily ATPase